MRYPRNYDVIVVGGGHAGAEAAFAAARMGARTLLLSQSVETIGQMSCNPAIGGIGKSHLVKEIDALDGLMARCGDLAAIHVRTLNSSKGPAVRATRAQADRSLYRAAVRSTLESTPNLEIFQQSVVDLIVERERIGGVVTQMGLEFVAPAVVLTTGTFLGGKIHIGPATSSGGRAGDPPSIALAERLRGLPFRVGRLKTGTPPRIDGRSVNFDVMEKQPGDDPRPTLSYLSSAADHPEQRLCYITHTNEHTHALIREALPRSPLFSGQIEGRGPRYCPSIEDKVVRFAGRSSHQVFVEPEGLETPELYPNGVSTSLPFDVQIALVRSIRGFENAHITRPGYAIEYDFFDPRDLQRTLETRAIEGLYFAGQINGTTGYEEAAAQGLVAGANAAAQLRGQDAFVLRREEAYIGVLIDDLVTCGVDEPYRMFTSRAEYRLRLRQDNADRRLTAAAGPLRLVDPTRLARLDQKNQAIQHTLMVLDTLRYDGLPATKYLRRPEVDWKTLCAAFPDLEKVDSQIAAQVLWDVKYAGYIARQEIDVARQKRMAEKRIPDGFDYARIQHLRVEAREKLLRVRPITLEQAGRISGITPADLALLLVYLQ